MAGRLLAISDLHIGYPENRAYADALSPGDPGDWLIVAGDVGEAFADIGLVLASLASRFAKVIWTPGNHELWTLPSDPVGLRGAARYEALVTVCRRFGVVTPEDEFPVWDGPGGPVTVAPLFTLYDYSFHGGGADPAATAAADGAVSGSRRSAALAAARQAGIMPVDEGRLHADPYPSVAAWCRDRVTAAERRLAAVDGPVVLASHWPLVRDPVAALRHQEFAPWCGTVLTAGWPARHQALAAVYGHLHIPRTTRHDGVRFEEVSVGYPREWQRRGTAPPPPRVILGLPALSGAGPGPGLDGRGRVGLSTSMSDQPAPLRRWHAVVASGDPALLDDLLAEEVVFRSPAVFAPQEGRALTAGYLSAALTVLGPTLRYVSQWHDPASAVLEFEADLDGVYVQGVDILRWNAGGKLVSVTVMVRPLRGLQKLTELMAARLAAGQA